MTGERAGKRQVQNFYPVRDLEPAGPPCNAALLGREILGVKGVEGVKKVRGSMVEEKVLRNSQRRTYPSGGIL